MERNRTDHIYPHPRNMFLENITHHINIQPTALLPLFEGREERSGRQEYIFDIGENDSEGFFIDKI